MQKVDFIKSGILLLFCCMPNGIFAQEMYYYANGKKVKVREDKTSMVIYEKENQELPQLKSSSIKQTNKKSSKRLGNYSVIKSTTFINKSLSIDKNNIRAKKNGIITEQGDTLYLTNFIILKFKQGYSINDIESIFNQYNIVHERTKYSVVTLKVENIDDVIEASNKIYELGVIEWCRPNFLRKFQLHFDTRDKQYYIKNKYHYCGANGNDINVEPAWEITQGCPDIRVAVLDDGVEDHPALRDGSGNSRVLNGYSVPGAGSNGRPISSGSHGQCCAGIIAARHSSKIRGVAPNIRIVPVNLNFDGFQDENEWFDAINWAWEPDGGNADVLSNSWGPSFGASGNELFIEAINAAQTNGRGGLGAIVVFSSGNNRLNEVSDYAKASIAVGAINKYDTPAEKLKIFSDKRYTNIGPNQDLVAYGGNVDASIFIRGKDGDIRTIDRTGSNGYSPGDYYDGFSGTSAACPQVSGAAALILSVNPNLTRQEVENILFSTATDLGSVGKDNTYGYGKLNVYSALKEAIKTRNARFDLTEGYLSYSKTKDNFKMSFVGSPGCGIAPGIYWCDVYKAEASIPYSDVFIFEGDGLTEANPNTGEYWVNATQNGSNLDIMTFFYYVRINSGGQTVNKWVPYNPSSSWTRKYLVNPPANVAFNGVVNSGQTKNIFATNSIKLKTGFHAVNGSLFRASIVEPSGSVNCLPNPTASAILKSATIDNNSTIELKSDINEKQFEEEKKVMIYPNPSEGNFNIKFFNEINPNARIEIIDMTGKVVYKTGLFSNEQNIIFTNQPGSYIVKIYNGTDYYTDILLLK